MIRPPYPFPDQWEEINILQNAKKEWYWSVPRHSYPTDLTLNYETLQNFPPSTISCTQRNTISLENNVRGEMRDIKADNSLAVECFEEEALEFNSMWTERFAATLARMESKRKDKGRQRSGKKRKKRRKQ